MNYFLLILFIKEYVYLDGDQQALQSQAGSSMSGGLCEFIFGCFNLICCSKDPQLPYDFSHPRSKHLCFLSTSLAHLLERLSFSARGYCCSSLFYASEMSFMIIFFSSNNDDNCAIMTVLAQASLLIYCSQKFS